MYFIGVDVGSTSVRAALIKDDGHLIKKVTTEISVNNPKKDHYEQSSSEIWEAVCGCVSLLTTDFKGVEDIVGIGFDATCSLVVAGKPGQVLCVSQDEWNGDFDTIMWMDHRAIKEAEMINKLNHPVLQFVGGVISPEMETPKLCWLKKNLPEVYIKSEYFFDLADFLTWKCTGGNTDRSLCTTVCKWTYLGMEGKWDETYFKTIGLEDLIDNDFKRIGSKVRSPGEFCGHVSREVKLDMGLNPDQDVFVGLSMIDAHAGALGLLAIKEARELCPPDNQLSIICGTSACHMALSQEMLKVPGVWGPYYSAVLPNFFLSEGGQSAVAGAIASVLKSHASYESVKKGAGVTSEENEYLIHNYLAEIITRISTDLEHPSYLTKDVHVLTDFHGNRSPLADPNRKGAIMGLTLDSSPENLAVLYLATIQGLAYGTKQIVEQMEKHGHQIKAVGISGGLCHCKLFVETFCDVLNRPVFVPHEDNSVLIGAAMLGAAAYYRNIDPIFEFEDVIKKFEKNAQVFEPCSKVREYHQKKYSVCIQMQNDQMTYKQMMESN